LTLLIHAVLAWGKSKMHLTRTLTIVVLCVLALCYSEEVGAANNVQDSFGRVWCVCSAISPAPISGEDILLFIEGEPSGTFITMDTEIDTTPHVFLCPAGQIGIVWSRENEVTGSMDICSTTYDPTSGFWTQPSTLLVSPQEDRALSHPRLEISKSGTEHLLYIARYEDSGQQVSELIYRTRQDCYWSEPYFLSQPDERVESPEIYKGASSEGYPLVVVYLSTPQLGGQFCTMQDNLRSTIVALQRDNPIDPDPWRKLSKHLLPINTR